MEKLKGEQADKDSFERPRAALRHREEKGPDAGEILGTRHGHFTEHQFLSRMEKLTAIVLQRRTGRSCSSPRASRTLLRPGLGNRDPGEGSVAACSPEVYVPVSQCPRLALCTAARGLSVAVPREICTLVFSGDSEYVRLLFPGSPLG